MIGFRLEINENSGGMTKMIEWDRLKQLRICKVWILNRIQEIIGFLGRS